MMTNKHIPISFVILCLLMTVLLVVAGKADDNDEPISTIIKLKKDLLAQYDKYALPVKNSSTSVPVWIKIVRLKLIELNEVEQKLVLDITISMRWIDEHLRWNPDKYNGIDKQVFQHDEIWRPEIVLYRSAPTTNNIPWNKTHVFGHHSGVMFWMPQASISVRCPMPLLKPMEERICNLTMASYLHHKHEIDFQLETVQMKVDDLPDNNNPVWKITDFQDTIRTLQLETAQLSIATFIIHIKQRYDFVGDVVQGPRTVAILLTLTMFWIPPNSNKKLNLACLMLLVLAGIMLYLSSTVISPSILAATVSPLRITIFTITSALLIEVIIINLSRLSDIVKPSPVLIRILSGTVGKVIGVCYRLEYKEDGEMIGLPETEGEAVSQLTITIEEEWALVAMTIDRIFFIIYAVIFIIVS